MKVKALFIAICVCVTGCAPARSSDGYVATEISAPRSGVRCFVITQGDRAVGGNCALE